MMPAIFGKVEYNYMTNNMTTGKPAKLILQFMIPTCLGNIFQQFYNLADSIVAGRFIGVNALAAIGSTSSLIFLVIGWVNGYIVAKFKVLSFITTLGISTVLDGLIYRLTGGATVFENIPKSFTWLGTSKIGGIPFLSVLMILFVLAFAFFMKHTPSGRKMYAIGGGEEASKIAGINVRTYKILAFMLCGALAGGTGIAVASRVGSANTSAGAGYFLQSYAAAYIGCTVSRQGIPNVAGTFVGAAILSILANGLTILQMPSYMQNIITGIIIVVAVIAQKLGRGDAK